MPVQALRQPTTAHSLLDQAEAQARAGKHKTALALLVPLLEEGAADVRSLSLAAGCYWALEDSVTAIALMRVAVEAAPDNALAWGKLGAMALYVGDKSLAREAYGKTVRLNPRSAPALAALNRLVPFKPGGRHVRLLRELSRDRKLPARDRMLALNALGRVEDAAGNPKAAFHHFTRSKALAGGRYDPAAMDRKLADQRRLFDPGALPSAQANTEDARMVFIVGLPRSGTTLTEGILARHSQVRSIGESMALTEVMLWLRKGGEQSGAWDFLTDLTPARLKEARQLFLARAGVGEADAGRVVVDKMPMDCLDLGLARLILPEARFVFMARHPLDVGLSNFVTAFDRGNGFTTRADWMGHITRIVYASLEDYQPKLGESLRRQSYRALVEESEGEIRALLQHVGLDWEAACLTPEAAGGAVKTASVLQVREQINRSGLGKWRAYEAHLEPLIDALGGWAWIKEWEAQDLAGSVPWAK